VTRIFPNAATIRTTIVSSNLSRLQQEEALVIVVAITTIPTILSIQNAETAIVNSVSYHTPS